MYGTMLCNCYIRTTHIIYLRYLTSVFLRSVLNFYDTLCVSTFEFFWDVPQDVALVK